MKIRVPMLVSILFVLFAATFAAASDDIRSIVNSRLANREVLRTIQGIIVYLDDMQVRNRPGTRSSFFDASDAGDGCDGKVEFNVPLFQKAISLPALPPVKVRNVEGEWESTVHFLPKKMGTGGKSLVAIPDSNLFVPAFVMYPLFMFRESVSAAGRPVSSMLKLSWNLDKKYRRGIAYNFWLPMKDMPSYSGPYNIPLDKAILPLAKAYLNPKLKFFWSRVTKGMNVPPPDWVIACLDSKKNASGAYALFNIPNDADDTATAIAIQKIKGSMSGAYPDDAFYSNASNFAVDMEAMRMVLGFRDVGRDPAFEDGRDSWKGVNTGAFLTWLLDENKPTFGDPANGVIPLAKNNVDAVVNSNVLLALGLLEMKDAPGRLEACAVVSKAIEKGAWPACGLYYPQFMIFPYTASRAYRDGGNAELRPAMARLMRDVIMYQNAYASKNPGRTGSFPGGEDRTDFVSTALGVTTLLNIGIDVARDEGMEPQYKAAIEAGIDFLIKTRRKQRIKNPETFAHGAKRNNVYGIKWDSGLFFSASFWDLAQWRSDPFTNAMALEAFSKYILAYEFGGTTISSGRRIHVLRYTDDMDNRLEDIKFEVR